VKLSGRLREIEGNELLADVELLTHIPGGEELFRDVVERAKARIDELLREKRGVEG